MENNVINLISKCEPLLNVAIELSWKNFTSLEMVHYFFQEWAYANGMMC